MQDLLSYALSFPLVKAAIVGAIGGAVGAARADYKAFKDHDTPSKFLAYNWRVAAWRWFHGAISGGLGVFFGASVIEAAL